jgi:branched-chain amino acid transport system permease protein
MFFAAGLYGAGLSATQFGFGAPLAFVFGTLAGLILAAVIGAIVLRTSGVAFMIVTMMFAQSAYLATLYFGDITRGDEGFTVPENLRRFDLPGISVDLASSDVRYNLALLLLALAVAATFALVRSSHGRVLVAIRENESRAIMLGYDSFRYKLLAVAISGGMAAAAGAAYALLFAYVGSTFATIQYSIFPLLWTLLGGAGTVVGPFFGTLAMTFLIDFSSEYTTAYLLVVGVALVLLVLFFPRGLLGTIREKWLPWLH